MLLLPRYVQTSQREARGSRKCKFFLNKPSTSFSQNTMRFDFFLAVKLPHEIWPISCNLFNWVLHTFYHIQPQNTCPYQRRQQGPLQDNGTKLDSYSSFGFPTFMTKTMVSYHRVANHYLFITSDVHGPPHSPVHTSPLTCTHLSTLTCTHLSTFTCTHGPLPPHSSTLVDLHLYTHGPPPLHTWTSTSTLMDLHLHTHGPPPPPLHSWTSPCPFQF